MNHFIHSVLLISKLNSEKQRCLKSYSQDKEHSGRKRRARQTDSIFCLFSSTPMPDRADAGRGGGNSRTPGNMLREGWCLSLHSKFLKKRSKHFCLCSLSLVDFKNYKVAIFSTSLVSKQRREIKEKLKERINKIKTIYFAQTALPSPSMGSLPSVGLVSVSFTAHQVQVTQSFEPN